MQRGFTKLFNTIVTSTIWQEDDKTRIVWITMLAIADAFGNVFAALPGLASVANVTLEAAEKAVKNLLAPDPYSRTKDFEGRRIEEIDGGWHIINYGKYRKMMNEEERKEYKAKWAREKRRQTGTKIDSQGHPKTKNRQCGHIPSASSSLFASFPEGFEREWENFVEHRKGKKAPLSPRASELFLETLSKRPKEAIAALQMAIMRNWTGFKWDWFDNDKASATKSEPRMSPQQRQERINHLNKRKQEVLHIITDPLNPPSWAEKELSKVDAELQKL